MQISEAEFEIMKVIWSSADAMPSRDIIDVLSKLKDWKPKTVRTLISRLVQKEALAFYKGKNHLYYAKVTEEECLQEASNSFLDRFFGGSLKPMLSHFANNPKISNEDTEMLRQILDKHGEDSK